MGVQVYSIERVKALFDITQPLLAQLAYSNIHCFLGDGFAGLPQHAPFHGIIITAAAPEVPQLLLQQLEVGAHLVFPLGLDSSDMMRITRTRDGEYRREMFDKFRFVPMLKGTTE